MRFSKNIDFRFPMKRACAEEIETSCAEAPRGSARVVEQNPAPQGFEFQVTGLMMRLGCKGWVCSGPAWGSSTPPHCPSVNTPLLTHSPIHPCPRCLQDNKGKKDFGQACLKEVLSYEQQASSDYRLNHRLRTTCRTDIDALCKDVCHKDQGQVSIDKVGPGEGG